MSKIVITAALSGPATKKEQNPILPYTAEEFAEEAQKCYESGASIVHVHGRDPNTGNPTADLNVIRNVYEAIKAKAPKLIINLTSALGLGFTFEQRIRPIVEIKPELASLNTNTMNFSFINRKTGQILSDHIFENTFTMLVDFAAKMKAQGTKPEIEAYDLSHIHNALLVAKRGVFAEPMHFQFVFGVAGGAQFSTEAMLTMRSSLPPGSTWGTCGVGNDQYPSIIQAALLGGHIRVGLEDNVKNIRGNLAKGSYEQVEDAVKIAQMVGRDVASSDETRRILSITKVA